MVGRTRLTADSPHKEKAKGQRTPSNSHERRKYIKGRGEKGRPIVTATETVEAMMLSRWITRNGVRCGRILINSLAASSSIGERSITPSTLRPDAVGFIAFGSGEGCATNYRRSIFSTKATTRLRRSRRTPQHRTEEDDDANESNNSASSSVDHVGTMSSEQFQAIANGLLDSVQSAVTKLKDCNRGIEITRHPAGTSDTGDDGSTVTSHGGRLSIQVLPSGDLYWGGGTYWLTIIPNDYDGSGNARGGGVVTLQSPLSGSFMYIYNTSTKEWVGSEDGHSLLGMLTRDWIRQCSGVPDL